MKFLQRLIKLANDLDSRGLFGEADELDAIIRNAADGVFGPGTGGLAGLPTPSMEGAYQRYKSRTSPDNIKTWQSQYNAALQLLQKRLGFLPSGMTPLKVDGIRGKNTIMAMNYVKQILGGKGTLKNFVETVVANEMNNKQLGSPAVATREQITDALKKYVEQNMSITDAPLDAEVQNNITGVANKLFEQVAQGQLTQKQLLSAIVDSARSIGSQFEERMYAQMGENPLKDFEISAPTQPKPSMIREPRGGQIGTYMPIPDSVMPTTNYPIK